MSFRDFDLPRVERDFGLSISTNRSLFPSVTVAALTPTLSDFLHRYGALGLANATDKARSEFLVAPLLAEVWDRSQRTISTLSGVEFNVDVSLGLNGICDFILTRSPQTLYVSAPVLVVVEAKRDSIVDGLGQCAAEMIAAQRFNQQAGNRSTRFMVASPPARFGSFSV